MFHDQRFKTLIRVFFKQFMELFCEDWMDLLDLTDLTWLEQEISTDPVSGPRQVLDLVVRVRTREKLSPWHDSETDEFPLAILIEIESPDRTTSIRERMPTYTWNLRTKLGIPVLPIVVFQNVGLEGIGVLVHERKIRDLTAERLDYLYVGLPGLDAVQYLQTDNWLGVALSSLMRIPKDRTAWLGAEALKRLASAPLDDQQRFILCEFVRAYLPLTAEQERELDGLLQTETYSEVKAMNVTVFEKGELNGLISGLLLAVELKFGRVDSVAEKLIRALDDLEKARSIQSLLRTPITFDVFVRELQAV